MFKWLIKGDSLTDDFERKIPLRKALLYVFFSVLLIWGSLSLGWWYRSHTLQKRQKNPLYNISTIIQTSRSEAMPSWQLAELLELSHDFRTNLYCFDSKAAIERLQACPVIKKALVRKAKPGIIYIDYETREAKVFVADYDNMVCDREGSIFPLLPFFSPKSLPEVYLGIRFSNEKIAWDTSLKSEKLDLAFSIIDFVETHFPVGARLLRVDVHKAFAPSAGEREVILLVQEGEKNSFVRLRGAAFEADLRLFLALQPQLKKMENEHNQSDQIVDLRSPGIALVK